MSHETHRIHESLSLLEDAGSGARASRAISEFFESIL